jgi:hypothetical protein
MRRVPPAYLPATDVGRENAARRLIRAHGEG